MDQIKLTGGADLLGRLLLAALFLFDGWTVVNNYGATAEYLAQFGVPTLLLIPALILQVGGGLLVAVGWKTRLAALALSSFVFQPRSYFTTIPATQTRKSSSGKIWQSLAAFLYLPPVALKLFLSIPI